MNIENLDKLIAALEAAPDEKFNIAKFFSGYRGRYADVHACGTAACIAGWAMWAAGKKGDQHFAFEYARDFLGISERSAWALFMPQDCFWWPDRYPRSRAIATLMRLRDTGDIDWGRWPEMAS